jgi:hypothetical protein
MLSLLVSIKSRSMSVFLVKGIILNDKVKSNRCENCNAASEVLAVNFANPNLLLYGCMDKKCKQKILKLNFDDPQLKTD